MQPPRIRKFAAVGQDSHAGLHRRLRKDGHAAGDFRFDPGYPDLAVPRNDDFVLIEILLSTGRSVKVKKKIVAGIIAALERTPGLSPDGVMIAFKETLWENWSFGGGRFLHA